MLTGLNFLEITRHQNRNRNERFREFCNRPLVLRTLIQYYNISRKKCFGEVRVLIWQVATSRKTIHFFWWFIFVQIFIIIQLKCPLEHYMPRLQRCALLYSSNLLTANMVYLCFLAAHYPLLQPSLVWGKKTPKTLEVDRLYFWRVWNLEEVLITWPMVFRGVLLTWGLGGICCYLRLCKNVIIHRWGFSR